jgi:hypothetical protein
MDTESMVFVVMIIPGENARVLVVVHERAVPEVLAVIRARMPLVAPHVEPIPEALRVVVHERNVPSILARLRSLAPHMEPVHEAMSLPSILVRLRSLAPLEPAPPAEPIPEAMLVPCAPLASDRCSICLESGSSWIALSRCHHRFHAHCIRQCCGPRVPCAGRSMGRRRMIRFVCYELIHFNVMPQL